jgi:lipopolysaccharide export system protein LptC
MTVEADRIQDRRRIFATPGGSHDRLIGFLSKALPAGIGLVAAVMILTPLSPRGEVGFLLDRNKVAVTNDRLAVDKAMYRGQDNKGRTFSVLAGNAVQVSADNPIVGMSTLQARMQMNDGPAEIRAPKGAYNYNTEKLAIAGPVDFTAADGYRMVTQNVDIDLKSQKAVGGGGISGTVPTGTFQADSIVADLEARTVTLDGNARLRMTPGKMRVPQ